MGKPRILGVPPVWWYGAAVVAALICFCMLFIDIPTALYFKEYRDSGLYRFFWKVSKLGDATWWVILALGIYLVPNYLLPALRRWSKSEVASYVSYRYHLMTLHMLGVLGVGTLIVQLLKHTIGRVRPTKFFDTGVHEFNFFSVFQKSDAFPSGHSQVIWAVMISLYIFYPRLRWLYLAIACSVSFSRVVVLKHYPADIIAGAALSIALGYYFKSLIERRWGGFRYGGHPA